jgi:endo-1,4-beta-xylanase
VATLGATSIAAGGSTTGTAVTKDAAGNVLTGRPITWSSSNTAVASVNAATGAVLGVAAGTVNIIAASGAVTGQVGLTVTAPSGQCAATPTLRCNATARNVQIGAAVDMAQFLWAPDAAQYQQVLGTEFNTVVAENQMKFWGLHPDSGVYDFSVADQMVSFAQSKGMAVHGHTLVWDQGNPAWLTGRVWTKAQLLAIMKDHILTVVGHYAGKVSSWDVANEVMDWDGTLVKSFWMTTIGAEYIDSAFVWAHRADPAAKLYYNDYGKEGPGLDSDSLLAQVKRWKARGVPIDGVGFQSHYTDAVGSAPTASAMYNNLLRYTTAGFDVRISELDVGIQDGSATGLTTEANIYRDVLDTCLKLPRCTGVTAWGFTDRYSWIPIYRPGTGRGLPLDDKYQPKPAYTAMIDRFHLP